MQPIEPKEAQRCGFDAHHPPEKRYLDDCVHCGFCLPACPTYVLWGEEMDSPRGRIYMIRKAADGEAPLDGSFRKHMDNCLGCMACMTACPRVCNTTSSSSQRAHRSSEMSRAALASGSFADCCLRRSRILGGCVGLRCRCLRIKRADCVRCSAAQGSTSGCRNALRPWRHCCPKFHRGYLSDCHQRSSRGARYGAGLEC